MFKPCGKTTGHGERCCRVMLCATCEKLKAAEEHIGELEKVLFSASLALAVSSPIKAEHWPLIEATEKLAKEVLSKPYNTA
jgi:hypothetical protein